MLEEERLLTFVLQLLLNGLLAFLIKKRAVQPSKYSVVHASNAKNKPREEKLEDKQTQLLLLCTNPNVGFVK